jgi:peroxiredoxin
MPAFDRRIADFEAANTQVLGISTDSPFSHASWAKALLSDLHRTAVRDYGIYAPEWNANSRATFIVDTGGTIRFIERYGRGELPDPDRILAEVKKLT